MKYISGNLQSKLLMVTPALNVQGDESLGLLSDNYGKQLKDVFNYFGFPIAKCFAVMPACLGPDSPDSEATRSLRNDFVGVVRQNIASLKPRLVVAIGTQAFESVATALKSPVTSPNVRSLYDMNGTAVLMLPHPRLLAMSASEPISYVSILDTYRREVAYCIFRCLQALRNQIDLPNLHKMYRFVQDGVDLYDGKYYEIVDTVEKAQNLVSSIRKCGYYVYDFETTSLLDGEVVHLNSTYSKMRYVICLGLAVQGKAYVVPFSHGDSGAPKVEDNEVYAIIRECMEDTKLHGISHNSKFEYEVCNRWLGWNVQMSTMDTMIMNHAFECRRGSNRLNIVAQFVGLKDFKEDAFGGAVDSMNLFNEPWERVYRYNAFDCIVTEQIALFFCAYMHLGSDGQRLKTIGRIMHKNLVVINDMSYGGARVDLEMFDRLHAQNLAAKNEAWDALFNHPDANRYVQEYELMLAKKKWKTVPDNASFEQMMTIVAERGLKNRPTFNLGSDTQMAWLMYEKLKYPVYLKTEKGRPSTADDAISRLAAEGYEIAKLLSEYRKYEILENMFFQPTMNKVVMIDGEAWVFPDWKQHGTESGRLANSNPNLQQYPSQLKPIIIPDDNDSVIIDADESQLELRLIALWGEDKLHELQNENEPIRSVMKKRKPVKHRQVPQKKRVMSDAYRRFLDLHRISAYRFYIDKTVEILSLSTDQLKVVSKVQRKQGKRTNFGIGYGMGAAKFVRQSLAEGIECSLQEAEDMIKSVFETFPCIPKFKDEVLWHCRFVLLGKTFTHFGTRRPMPELFSSDWKRKGGAEREAFNNPIQGDGGIMTQLCAYYFTHRCLENSDDNPDWLRVRVIAIIHDSVVVSAPKIIAEEAARELYDCLANPAQFEEMADWDFPFDSSVEVGWRWGKTVPVCGDDKPETLELWDIGGALEMALEKERKETEEWQRKSKSESKPKSTNRKKVSLI